MTPIIGDGSLDTFGAAMGSCFKIEPVLPIGATLGKMHKLEANFVNSINKEI